jgi:hypothetical protein
VEQLRTLIQRVNQWVEKLQGACPTRLSKRRSRAKATVRTILQTLPNGNLQLIMLANHNQLDEYCIP